jgi:hypothetical protein
MWRRVDIAYSVNMGGIFTHVWKATILLQLINYMEQGSGEAMTH